MPHMTEQNVVTAAGMYDAHLGGTNHTPAEAEAAATVRAAVPEVRDTVWANRAFHQRAVRFMAEQGVRQFIDLGAGLPTQDNTHQVLQRIDRGVHVVYVDIDPHAAELGRGLIENEPYVRFVQADMRHWEAVLGAPEVVDLIDFSQPVGLLASAVFHFLSDEDDPWSVARHYIDALPSGSYVAISHATTDRQRPGPARATYSVYKNADAMIRFRSRDQVEWLFNGLEFVEPYKGGVPKVQYVGIWFCEDPAAADDGPARWFYAGVARKP